MNHLIGCIHVASQQSYYSLKLRWRSAKNSLAVTMVTIKIMIFYVLVHG